MSNLIHVDFARRCIVAAPALRTAEQVVARPLVIPAHTLPHETTKRFKVGETYYGSHVCDSESVFEFTVIKRNPKSVTIENVRGDRKTVKIHGDGSDEYVFPYGRYSMAAILSASRKR